MNAGTPISCLALEAKMTQKLLKSKLHYNKHSGLFIWVKTYSPHARKNKIAGTLTSLGYVIIRIDKKDYQAHRLAWLYEHGEYPTKQIDHINHIKDDNTICNLRVVSISDNQKNVKRRVDNTSDVTGVYFNKLESKWVASISSRGKRIHLGYFIEKKDAIKARKHAEKIYCFHKNHGISQKMWGDSNSVSIKLKEILI